MKVICNKVGAHQECSNCGASQPHDPICCEPCGFVEGAACESNPINQQPMQSELNREYISNIVKSILRNRRMTVVELAKRIGMTRSNLTNTLNCKAGMTLDNAMKMFNELGITVISLEDDSNSLVKENAMLKRDIETYKSVIQTLANPSDK